MTAAHCTCSDELNEPETNYPCRNNSNSNQIEKGKNDIAVLGGSKSRDSLFSSNYGLAWKIVVANVMDGFLTDVRHINYDIGMLKIDD